MSWIKKLLGFNSDPIVLTEITDSNFKEEISKSDLPVVLDLWGPGCQPCKQLVPIMKGLAKKYKGKIKVAHCDVSTSPTVARRFGVRGTPTVLYFRKGKVIEKVVGFKGSLYHTEIVETEFLGNEFTI
jgi:thioredoxin